MVDASRHSLHAALVGGQRAGRVTFVRVEAQEQEEGHLAVIVPVLLVQVRERRGHVHDPSQIALGRVVVPAVTSALVHLQHHGPVRAEPQEVRPPALDHVTGGAEKRVIHRGRRVPHLPQQKRSQ